MTVALEEFTGWRHSIEVRLGRLEAASDMNAANLCDHGGLLTAMDKDVSDTQAAFRAQLAVLNSVRETQSEQTRTLREHSGILREHSGILREHTRALAELREGLTETRIGVRTIIDLLRPSDDDEEPGGNSPI
jgi:hypothetical protein